MQGRGASRALVFFFTFVSISILASLLTGYVWRNSYLILDGYGLSYRTVHSVIKKHDLTVRVKPKKEPRKHFERRHPDGLWQMDIHEFRIRGIGRVKVFGIIDDHPAGCLP